MLVAGTLQQSYSFWNNVCPFRNHCKFDLSNVYGCVVSYAHWVEQLLRQVSSKTCASHTDAKWYLLHLNEMPSEI